MPEHTMAQNLTRLQNARLSIQTAITNKFGALPNNSGYEDFAAAIGNIPIKIPNNDYSTIAKIVRAGLASTYFHIGDQIITTYTDTSGNEYEMPWDIADFRNVTLENGITVPGMIIQSHYATVEEIQFDAAEPNRPAEQDYQGQIAQYGWNRYAKSAYRQWLNSSAIAGEWWTAQHEYDAAPSQANTVNGFIHGLPSTFLEMLKPVKVETCRNYRDPDTAQSSGTYEYDITYDRFWLPSKEEEYTTVNEPNHREGMALQYWIDSLTAPALEKGESLPQQSYVSAESTHSILAHRRFALNNTTSSAAAVRLRSADRYNACNVWYVSAGGYVGGGTSAASLRCAPACAIC